MSTARRRPGTVGNPTRRPLATSPPAQASAGNKGFPQASVEEHDQLLISKPIRDELLRVLGSKFSRDAEELAHVAVFLSDLAVTVTPRRRLRVVKDEPDNRILGDSPLRFQLSLCCKTTVQTYELLLLRDRPARLCALPYGQTPIGQMVPAYPPPQSIVWSCTIWSNRSCAMSSAK
jgi:hypothetical protein